jgi:hypothetical protein
MDLKLKNQKRMSIKYNDFTPDSVVQTIIERFVERAKFGEKKYGTNLDRKDLSLEDWLEHSIQEKLDDILYMQKALKEIQDGR